MTNGDVSTRMMLLRADSTCSYEHRTHAVFGTPSPEAARPPRGCAARRRGKRQRMEETAAAFFADLDVAGAPRDLVALGGRLDVGTPVAAYPPGPGPTAGMPAAYRALHRAGVAHSVEVWAGDDLVGGLYGVLTGRVFAGESMFHRSSDASKVAVVDLCRRLAEAGVVMIDTQDESDHMARLGQLLLHRDDYNELLHRFRDEPATLPADRRPVADLSS